MIQAAIPFPNIDPFLFEWNGFGIRWYALAYIVGLLLAWRLAVVLTSRAHLWRNDTPPFQPAQAESLLFMLTIGVILGGRLGFVLFYNWDYYSQNPLDIFKTWEGGMSFHGGLLGVVVGGLVFCRLTRPRCCRPPTRLPPGCRSGCCSVGWRISSTVSCGANRGMGRGRSCSLPIRAACRAIPATPTRQGWRVCCC